MAGTKDITRQKIISTMSPKKAGQFMLLGLLWLLCCIPVITAGTATCAVFYAGIKILNDEPDLKAAKLFFKGVKQNFVQGILMFLVSVITLGGFGALVVWSVMNEQNLLIIFLTAACELVALIFNSFAYAVIGRYENTFANAMRNALALVFTFMRDAIQVTLFLLCEIAVDVFLFRLNLIAGFVSLLFWPSVIFYTVSFYMTSIFYKVEHPVKYDDEGNPVSE